MQSTWVHKQLTAQARDNNSADQTPFTESDLHAHFHQITAIGQNLRSARNQTRIRLHADHIHSQKLAYMYTVTE